MSDDPYKHSGVAERLAHAAGMERGGATADRVNIALTKQLHRSMTLNARLKNAVRDTIESIDVFLLPEFPSIAKTLKDTLKKGDKDSDPEATFEAMLTAAHEAYDTESRRWKVHQSSVGGIVEPWFEIGKEDLSKPMGDEYVMHRFDTMAEARFFRRDKVLRAALEAALKAMAG